jgi:glycosyltransferase involved in cell wall biosynthesis
MCELRVAVESVTGRVAISIIVPALNEAESIGQVVGEMPWERIAECVVVDNGSTDGTAEIARAAGARVVESPRGYGAACKAGADAAVGEILVWMDGDGSDVIAGLDALVGPIERDEADFVIGSRVRGRREAGSLLPWQVFAGWFVGQLLWATRGVRYTDMGPFRAMRRVQLQRLQMQEMTYGWNLEMQIKASEAGLRIVEIPVDYRRRIGGTSKVSGNLRASFVAGVRIVGVLLRVRGKRRAG